MRIDENARDYKQPKEAGTKKNLKLFPYADLFEKPLRKTPMNPSGIVIHYTAGASARSSVSHLMKQNLGYHLIIDRDGTIFQMYDLDSSCSHSGNAWWNGDSPNRNFLSVAVCSFGLLTDTEGGIQNMYGTKMNSFEQRDGQYWEPATHEQEDSLLEICDYLCRALDIDPNNICGHDECCIPKGRKVDPGKIFGFSMPALRVMMQKSITFRP